jgi:hypothetical protein
LELRLDSMSHTVSSLVLKYWTWNAIAAVLLAAKVTSEWT